MNINSSTSAILSQLFQINKAAQLSSNDGNPSLNKLSDLAQQGSKTFWETLQPIFGSDISEPAFEAFRQDLLKGNFTNAPIEADPRLPQGTAAFDKRQEKILLSPEIARLGETDPNNRLYQRTLSEETGHYIDHQLRTHYSSIGGDASHDEGASFAKEIGGFTVSKADIIQDTKMGELEFHDEAGHYFTTLKVAESLGFNDKDSKTIALWSQLPDEIGAYDATIAQIEKVSKVSSKIKATDDNGTVLGDTIKSHRDNVQTLIHSLDGSDPASKRELLKRFIRQNRDNLPLVGIAVHAYGDTYAHTVKGTENQSDAHTYNKGLGHFSHWTAPDEIHRRPDHWKTYVNDLTQVLGKNVLELDQTELDNIIMKNKKWSNDMILDINKIVTKNTYINEDPLPGEGDTYVMNNDIAEDVRRLFKDEVDPKSQFNPAHKDLEPKKMSLHHIGIDDIQNELTQLKQNAGAKDSIVQSLTEDSTVRVFNDYFDKMKNIE